MRKAKVVSVIVGIVALGLAGWVAYLLLTPRSEQQAMVSDFASCVAAGNPVSETSPRQCRTADGTTYTEPAATGDSGARAATTFEFTSPKGVTVRLHDWAERRAIASPLEIKGEVPGSWSFEGSFPLALSDPTNKIIAQAVAALEGEWMTNDYVLFTATLTFDAPSEGGGGVLMLRKDNPSGLPENDDAIEVPVTFSTAE